MRRILTPGASLILVSMLIGCTQSSTPRLESSPTESAQTLMVRVAKQMQICWFKGKDPALRRYKMANEINSFSGKPRVLIVPRNKPQGLPKLVVQAERIRGRNILSSFGPLLQTKDGPRLNAAVRNWERGSTSCA